MGLTLALFDLLFGPFTKVAEIFFKLGRSVFRTLCHNRSTVIIDYLNARDIQSLIP